MLPILGAQLGDIGEGGKYLVANRVYEFDLLWDEIELTPGIYTFPAEAFDIITTMNNKLGKDGYKLIIGAKLCPTFYSIPPHARNSPPAQVHYTDYAKFVAAICATFAPWGVELWNEPEGSVYEAGNNPHYGGFGLELAGEYGKLTALTYGYLYRRGITTRVLAGASLGTADINRSLEFLRLARSGGMRSHYWTWHGYNRFHEAEYSDKAFYAQWWFSNEAYKIYPKPQLITEMSLLRDHELPEDPNHRRRQADFLQFMLKQRPGTKVESMLWYTLANNGWMRADLIYNDVEYPAYQVWKDYAG